MQRLLVTGLSFAICALCAVPAFAAEEEAAEVAPELLPAGSSFVWIPEMTGYPQTAEDLSRSNLHYLDSWDQTGSVPAGYFSYDMNEFEEDFGEADYSLDCDASTLMAQNAQLDCLGEELARGCQDWDSPFSGQITYRMQFSGSGLSDLGNFQQGVRFDLRYREWLSDNFMVNLEIGSRDSSVFDVISGRHGNEAKLERAYVEGHFD